ncbi:MAG: class I SAM-dependent methyltransferase [Acidobacteriota bacterium]|nr:class I SAM-dependent methyltransferase [Acidobacteriota bacterium]
MHDTAGEFGRRFFEFYWKDDFASVIDLGALNINGSLRNACPKDATYVGVDLIPGLGVDVVVEDPYRLPFDDESFDVGVSTSCFEHNPMFWLTFLEIIRVIKPKGYLYLNCPSNGYYHAYPVDCWRFYPDAGLALEMWAKHSLKQVTLLESFVALRQTDQWNDNVMIFQKSSNCVPPSKFLVDEIPTAENIHKCGVAGLIRANPATEDQRIILAATADSIGP